VYVAFFLVKQVQGCRIRTNNSMFPFPWVHQKKIRDTNPVNATNVDDPSQSGISDDLVAEELLTRFPEYGTTTPSLISIVSSNDERDDENWIQNDDNEDVEDFGTNQSSAMSWQRKRKVEKNQASVSTATKVNNSWWMPALPANVPGFASSSVNDNTKGNVPQNEGNTIPETMSFVDQPSGTHSGGRSLDSSGWDPIEQSLWKPAPPPLPPITLATKDALRTGTKSSAQRRPGTNIAGSGARPPAATVDGPDWMPDELYKSCALCEAPFTIFRRKHHCRYCGQIFCNVCSSYHLPQPNDSVHGTVRNSKHLSQSTQQQLSLSTVRVCKTCYDQCNTKKHSGAPPLTSGKSALHPVNESKQAAARTTMSTTSALEQPAASLPPPPLPALPAEKSQLILKKVKPNASSASTSVGTSDNYQQNFSMVQEGQRHIGQIAADHLELVAKELLRLHAPLIWSMSSANNNPIKISSWVNALLTFATRCCATVNPNVKKGDFLDIRPYVKVKAIPGGSYRDCAYLSGVMFRKTVSHKRMAREVLNPRILLLSGGIDFVRNAESRISSLETLFEQEDKYMELLVSKLVKLEPDVVLVGRSVNRKAHELLVKANIILIQQVKLTLLNRIARQTGATIVSSTDYHSMNQLNKEVLGKCCRFRLVTFRDNEVWTENELVQETNDKCNVYHPSVSNDEATNAVSVNSHVVPVPSTVEISPKKRRSIKALLADQTLSNHERQAALAAQRLGENVLDGTDAVRAGLAKRGVAHTYVMLEGCPKHLGCTVVLRGADRAALKELKGVFRFLVNFAYNIRLETTYLKERGARIRPDFQFLPSNACSSSLCVDYGQPPDGRKVRPWNGGGKNELSLPRGDPGELSAVDHQSILITSVWMTEKTQCCPAEVKGICYYSQQDVALGQFLRDSCFNLSLKCQNPNCKKSVLDHSLSFVHNDGLINIVVSTALHFGPY
jgi:TCP-1/cpn60 chaperonin family/FYVE zinc finger